MQLDRAGIPGAGELLERARDVMLHRFWDEAAGRCSEHYANADWTEPEAYRGANANMHTVEAFLTPAAATGESDWARRALRIAEPLMNVEARRLGWRVAEHFDLRLADMTSKRRPENIAFPRQIAMFLSRQMTENSLNSIGEAFGGRDHGTVLHACRLVKDRMEVDSGVRQTVMLLEKKLRR